MTTPRMFDQMLEDNGGQMPAEMAPNQRISGEVIFEPLGAGIRVTGRTEQHKLLWGMVCSKGMLDQPHASIAMYAELRQEVEKALAAQGLPVTDREDEVASAVAAIERMQAFLAAARKKITVKKISSQTKTRAAAIAKAVSDAHQMTTLEVPFVGIQPGDADRPVP
jgi:hypothetical protein